MRNAFIKSITEIGKEDRVVLLINDTGQFVLRDFDTYYPGRLINIGIAEQNMVGLAAGLAASGKVVFVYSIASFFTRAYEQIKVDICYPNLNVKFIGVGAGLAYGTMGITHHATEDLAIFRALPNVTIISPCDPIETEQATAIAMWTPGPVYLRLALTGEPAIHDSSYRMQKEQADILRDGKDMTFIATGRVVKNALDAADILATHQITCRVINIHTVKPIDRMAIVLAAFDTKTVLTIEEHNITGGLGSAVAEILAESEIKAKLWRFGLPGAFCQSYGSWEYLQHRYNLTGEYIAKEILQFRS